MPLTLLRYHLIDDMHMSQEKLINTAKLHNFQLQADHHPQHSNSHKTLMCSVHINEILFHLQQIKFTPLTQNHHGDNGILKIKNKLQTGTSLNFTYNEIPAFTANIYY